MSTSYCIFCTRFHKNYFLSKTKVWKELTLHSAETQTAEKSSCSTENILLEETESSITVGYTHTILYSCQHTHTHTHTTLSHTRRSDDVLPGRRSLHCAARRDRCLGFGVGAARFGASTPDLLLHGDPEEPERSVGERGEKAEEHRWLAGAQFSHHPVLVLRQGIRGQTPLAAGPGDSNMKLLILKKQNKTHSVTFVGFKTRKYSALLLLNKLVEGFLLTRQNMI